MSSEIIRVFARRTKFTPVDDLAFYDAPPMFPVPDLPVCVSITFTWDIAKGKRLVVAWKDKCRPVLLGGPAFDNLPGPGKFVPGRFLKLGVTITSRGCPKKCPWCFVPKREGRLREIEIQPGYIVQDNNLLACSDNRFERVCNMLSEQNKGAEFKGGLDVDYLRPWHVERLKGIRVNELWVACDTDAALAKLDKAADLLADFPIWKKRCYVMVGFNGENTDQAERRLEAVYAKGFLPFVRPYKSADKGEFLWSVGPEGHRRADLIRKWSRPAAYRGKKVKSGEQNGKEESRPTKAMDVVERR